MSRRPLAQVTLGASETSASALAQQTTQDNNGHFTMRRFQPLLITILSFSALRRTVKLRSN